MPRKELYIKVRARYMQGIKDAAAEVKGYRDTLRRNGLRLRQKRARNDYMVLDSTGRNLTDYMPLEELREYMQCFERE